MSEGLNEGELKSIERLRKGREQILEQMRRVIVGQEEVVEQLLTALFSKGHCLLVGVPGLAKTLMVKTMSTILDLDFKRIQFTPDLMPADIMGTDILQIDQETGKRSFEFIKGPVFTNLLLADEINRTPPKTQAALLEAMQEYKVTAAGKNYEIEPPFLVLATQNPIEQEGTYPLPEAQLDRFMFNVYIEYPDREDEIDIMLRTTVEEPETAEKVLTGSEIIEIQKMVRRVPVSRHVASYAVDLVRATRPGETDALKFIKDWVSWGAGPRACQFLLLGAKARAMIHGRYNVSCEDIRAVALPTLRHRIFTNFNADSEGITVEKIVAMLLEEVREMDAKDY